MYTGVNRIRQTGPEEVEKVYTRTYTGTNYSSYDTNQHVLASSVYKYMDDWVDEQFKVRQGKGEIFNNPMTSHSEQLIECPPTKVSLRAEAFKSDGTLDFHSSCNGERSWADKRADFLPLPAIADDFISNVTSRAVTNAYANRSAVEMAVSMTVAEGRKTIQGVYEILHRVINIARAARRLDLRAIADELSPKELRDRYMELRYGIRPLMIDVSNVMKAYNAELGKLRKTMRGKIEDRVVYSDTVDSAMWGITFLNERTTAYNVEARAGVLCDVDASKLNVWGIDQIAETVWEVIPFSFILGWFCNIASIISSWTPKYGINELASWVTTTETTVQSVKISDISIVSPLPSPYDKVVYDWPGTTAWKTTVVKRRVPDPERGIWPVLDVNLDTFKILDLGIILSGLITGKVSTFMR